MAASPASFTSDLMLLNQQQCRGAYLVHFGPPNGYTLLPPASLRYDFIDNPTKKVQHRVKAEELQDPQTMLLPVMQVHQSQMKVHGHEETCIMQQ
jgi:hypothetical protein